MLLVNNAIEPRIAPIHHHFELKGVKEQKIVENFWKINILLVILGIVLKINL